MQNSGSHFTKKVFNSPIYGYFVEAWDYARMFLVWPLDDTVFLDFDLLVGVTW